MLLVTAIDWYAGIRRKSGETVSRSLVNAAARAIKRAVGENAVSAYLGDGRFATLLVGQSPAAVKSIAETLAKDFASRESHHESIPRPTLTSAIVPWSAGSTSTAFLNEALETLELAEHSGGDCVCLARRIRSRVLRLEGGNVDRKSVRQRRGSGHHGAVSCACCMLTPMSGGCPTGFAIQAFRCGRSSIATDVWSLPSSRTNRATRLRHPGDDTLAPPETISYDASFAEIYEAFSSRGCASLVVTDGRPPLGYLTCDGFLSMIDPIHASRSRRPTSPSTNWPTWSCRRRPGSRCRQRRRGLNV